MHTTSHFVGLKIKSSSLADIFIKIQNTLGNSKNSFLFQNILSAHITLFYFPDSISEDEKWKIAQIIKNLDISEIKPWIRWFEYFWDLSNPKLCYLQAQEDIILERFHHIFRKEFPQYLNITDNAYPIYTPHITLFHITNPAHFQEKRDLIEAILSEEIEKLKNIEIFESIELFQVNSQFQPEIQIILPLVWEK